MQTHFIGLTLLIFHNFVVMEIYDHIELCDWWCHCTTLFCKHGRSLEFQIFRPL